MRLPVQKVIDGIDPLPGNFCFSKERSGNPSRGSESPVDESYKSLPPKLRAMAKEKNTKQVNVKKEPTKSLKEKRAAKQEKREEKLKNRG